MNPEAVLEVLRIGAQLLKTLNALKDELKETNPELWAQIADDFNAAAAAFSKQE